MALVQPALGTQTKREGEGDTGQKGQGDYNEEVI